MKLTLEQIKNIAHGAVEVVQDPCGLIHLYRLTPYQRSLYQPMDDLTYRRSRCSAGIKLMLQTDSRSLTLDVDISLCTTRQFFSIDVYVDGKLLDVLDGYGHDTMFANHRKTFPLPEGMKTVSIYLPWSVLCHIRAVEVDEGAQVLPVHREKTILMYGDSITQGFDCLRPSLCYAARIADWLEAECYNKGMGSSRFFPPLLDEPEDLDPDYITVAFGTNDWCHSEKELFVRDSTQFLSRLRQQFPKAKLFVLAPIWRKGYEIPNQFGHFEEVAQHLQDICKGLPDTVVIDCFSFVPHDPAFYQDKNLHPNDEGFAHYFENLRKAMAPYV